MKYRRHAKILEIIEKHDVDTQEMLQNYLYESGFNVTQATVSRDIKELKLIKTLSDKGNYRYTTPPNNVDNKSKDSISSLFSEAVVNIDYALNTVVIKCHVGMAQAVCAKLDIINFHDVVGTLAGDDTIFVLVRNEQIAVEFVSELNNLILK